MSLVTRAKFSPHRAYAGTDGVRVCRDRIVNGRPYPEHLEWDTRKERIKWVQHREGGTIPAITREQFRDWLVS